LPASDRVSRRENGEKHGKGALEQFHIQAGLVFQRTERATKRLSDLLTEFFLVAGEGFERYLKITRHEHLHAVAVEADKQAQKIDGQQALSFLVLLARTQSGSGLNA
jgi:hypothetical protein